MELSIIRRAIALERDLHHWRDDGKRPLSATEARRLRKAAAGPTEFGKVPDRLLTSPPVRTRQTAGILPDVAGWPPTKEAPEVATSRFQERLSNESKR
jgi:phosphohistidine phosphatase SixA